MNPSYGNRHNDYGHQRGGRNDRRARGGDHHRGGGASHLARIHGTEEDRVNCPFYFKMGACRHGDRCSRAHNRPLFSQTILLSHMYANPNANEFLTGVKTDPEVARVDFEDFYIEVFEELAKSGEVEDLIVCDNLGDHMVGNVYAKFFDEEDAAAAINAFTGRYFAKRPIAVEVSPVTDFGEARCRKYDVGRCERGPFCNFMHIKPISRSLQRELRSAQPHAGVRSKPSQDVDARSSRKRRGRSKSSSRRHSRRKRSSSRRRDRTERRGDSGRHERRYGAEADVGDVGNGGPPPVSRPTDPRIM